MNNFVPGQIARLVRAAPGVTYEPGLLGCLVRIHALPMNFDERIPVAILTGEDRGEADSFYAYQLERVTDEAEVALELLAGL